VRQQSLSFGEFDLNLAAEELRKSGVLLKLPPQPFQLLVLLTSRPGEVVTREEIRKQLWAEDTNVDFEAGVNKSINQIREALGDDAGQPRYLKTLPRRGYCFIAPVRGQDTTGSNLPAQSPASIAQGNLAEEVVAAPPPKQPWLDHRRKLLATVIVIVFLASAVLFVRRLMWSRAGIARRDPHVIVVSEITNTTGETIFDDTLRHAVVAQLEQSPFLNLVSDRQISHILVTMSQPGIRLSQQIARQVCQRAGGEATVEGSIQETEDRYALELRVVDCRSGNLLTAESILARRRDDVLGALNTATNKLRRDIGEPLESVQRYDVPLQNVTTPSLEALQAYSVGASAAFLHNDCGSAIPLLQKAVRLDANFALAYATLSRCYYNVDDRTHAIETARKAYELRNRVSDRERFYIESNYYQVALGDLVSARATYELWAKEYPNDAVPFGSLGTLYAALGDYEKALSSYRQGLKLDPDSGLAYDSVAYAYMLLNRLDEAQAVIKQEEAKGTAPVLSNLYSIAFLQADEPGMQHALSAAAGKEGYEDAMLFNHADTLTYKGRLANARGLVERAVSIAQQSKENETAAEYLAAAALNEAWVGNAALAEGQSSSALQLAQGREVKAFSALALALVGRTRKAQHLAEELNAELPEDTIVQFNYIPSIKGASFLAEHRPDQAIRALAPAAPYEMGSIGYVVLSPVYLRGYAYLMAGRPTAAVAEFQAILDRPTIVVNDPIGALARLGLGRAYAAASETAKAKTAYQDLFEVWKNADPDIPLLKQAKSEYARISDR
jgi:eukaryotic-like serine/threonine-protein kinase